MTAQLSHYGSWAVATSASAFHPCHKMTGSIASAATGSAHHHPNRAKAPRPTSSASDRYEQTHVSLESATRARLRISRLVRCWGMPTVLA
jgi:hypothetical protein